MVATIDPISKQASVLGFPRDLLITHDLPDGQFDSRINASYQLGFERGGTIEAGARQVQRDLAYNFGIETNHWMVMDFLGVEELIDAVGGIDIDVPEELAFDDWWYSDEGNRPPHWLSVFPGEQHMSGYTAVAFGRYRNGPDGDLGRIKRQQVVVEAALSRVFSLNLLNDPVGLYNAYKDVVKHDVSLGEMPGLARLMAGSRGDIETYSIGDPVDGNDTVWGYTTAGGAAVLLYDADNVTYWLNKAFPKASYSGAAVEVQNGFGEDGRARIEALGRYLRFAKGLPTVYLGPPQGVQARTTITLLREDRREVAEDIAEWLGIPAGSITTRAPADASSPDVIVVIGQDFVLPDR
jgi:LCP family protein required for cell wall assembly